MSPPTRLTARHLLNPWMRWHEEIDVRRASAQWERLAETIRAAGGEVTVMQPVGRSGALTFTRDGAVVTASRRAVVLRNHGQRGDLEPTHVSAWLRARRYDVEALPEGDRLDGGNVLPVPGGWALGLPPGSDVEVAARLADRLRPGRAVGVPLARAPFGHLDMVLADLAGRGWLAHPAGFVDAGMRGPQWASLLGGRPVITVDEAEAGKLACNVVVVGETVIAGGLSRRLCRAIERLGLEPAPVELDEFRKAGGGAHCLTLGLSPPRGKGDEHEQAQDAARRRAAQR